ELADVYSCRLLNLSVLRVVTTAASRPRRKASMAGSRANSGGRLCPNKAGPCSYATVSLMATASAASLAAATPAKHRCSAKRLQRCDYRPRADPLTVEAMAARKYRSCLRPRLQPARP